ncbi:hypothetical protein ACWDLL_05530 [Streptomyces griseoincarnatus]
MAQAGNDDAVQGGVGPPVAAVVEPARTTSAGGVFDGANSAKGGKGRLGVQPLGSSSVMTAIANFSVPEKALEDKLHDVPNASRVHAQSTSR